ncbi:hypothetical protein B6D60_02845 [candidate division KSB1 bacterium 4484_87]|nr:MAG: hypothetical protein B6D60_02845 [candidate division KSB1 bacterium 4484_87]
MHRIGWKKIDTLIFVLGILGLFVYLYLYPKSLPEGAIKAPLDKKLIVEKAKEFLDAQSVEWRKFRARPAFVHNANALHYYQINSGIEQANKKIADGEVPVFYWRVRFRQPQNLDNLIKVSRENDDTAENVVQKMTKDTLIVDLTTKGEVFGFAISVSLDSIEAVPRDSALQIALQFLQRRSQINLNDYQLLDPDDTENDLTPVKKFVWERNTKIDDFSEKLTVKVAGSGIVQFTRFFKPPKNYQASNDYPELKGLIIVLVFVIIFILMLVLFIYKSRNDQIEQKHNMLLSVFIALFWSIMLVQSLLASDTRGLLLFFMPLITTTPFIFLGFLIASSLGESEAREVWPEKLFTIDMFRSGSFFFPQWSMSILRGFSLAFISLGILVLGIQLFDWKLDFFTTIDKEQLYKKFSVVPVFYIFVQGAVSVSFGETVFRLFTISFLKRLLKKTVFVFIAAALTWLISFGAYSQVHFSSFWLTLTMNLVLACLLIFFFMKWDFLTVLWGAFSFYLIRELHPFLFFGNESLIYNGYALWVFLGVVFIIALLGLRSKYQDKVLREYVPDYKIRQQERERLARELEIAKQVQASFLPEKNPQISGLDIASVCIPAKEVGGDYYDFLPLGESKLGIVIGDVSGKGIPAAFHMTLTKGFLKSQAKLDLSPRELLINLNELFWENVKRGTFISMIYGIIDVRERKFTFARAGHNPLLILKSREGLRSVLPKGLALGLTSGEVFGSNIDEYELPLSAGDVLILYTDGFSEAMNPDKEEFGEENLEKLISELGHHSAQGILNLIENNVRQFVESAPQHDDMTMIVMKIME